MITRLIIPTLACFVLVISIHAHAAITNAQISGRILRISDQSVVLKQKNGGKIEIPKKYVHQTNLSVGNELTVKFTTQEYVDFMKNNATSKGVD